MNCESVLGSFEKKFGKKIIESRLDRKDKINYEALWIKVHRKELPYAVKHLFELGSVHFSVISANDFEKEIELVYEFTVGWGEPTGEALVNIKVSVPKEEPEIDTICPIVPAALVSEREKQEMFGITVRGIPDKRKMFLPEQFEGLPGIKSDERVDKLEVE